MTIDLTPDGCGRPKPAITPDGWTHLFYESANFEDWFEAAFGSDLKVSGETPHSIAARALHGQPFGFTWLDVDLLNAEAEVCRQSSDNYLTAPFLEDLAAKIAALLPPREAAS